MSSLHPTVLVDNYCQRKRRGLVTFYFSGTNVEQVLPRKPHYRVILRLVLLLLPLVICRKSVLRLTSVR